MTDKFFAVFGGVFFVLLTLMIGYLAFVPLQAHAMNIGGGSGGGIINNLTPPSYGAYCGDGRKNQSWEQCDGGAGCTAQCQTAGQCSEVILAKVNVTKLSNASGGNVSRNLYIGKRGSPIPAGKWFLLYKDGNYVNDQSILNYYNVPGIAVERTNGKIQLWVHSGNGRSGSAKEHVEGNIQFFGANVQGLQNGEPGLAGTGLEKARDGRKTLAHDQDEMWIANGRSNFWITTVKGGQWFADTFTTTYRSTVQSCPAPSSPSDPNVPIDDVPPPVPTPTPQCSDGIDNDGDGNIDLADAGCSSSSDTFEGDEPTPAQCADGIDNDGDGNIDLADAGCSEASDDNEANDPVLNPTADITVDPIIAIARKGDPVTILWTASDINSCSVSGPGIDRSYTTSPVSDSAEVIIQEQSTYTIVCQLGGTQVSDSVTVKLIPSFDEF